MHFLCVFVLENSSKKQVTENEITHPHLTRGGKIQKFFWASFSDKCVFPQIPELLSRASGWDPETQSRLFLKQQDSESGRAPGAASVLVLVTMASKGPGRVGKKGRFGKKCVTPSSNFSVASMFKCLKVLSFVFQSFPIRNYINSGLPLGG